MLQFGRKWWKGYGLVRLHKKFQWTRNSCKIDPLIVRDLYVGNYISYHIVRAMTFNSSKTPYHPCKYLSSNRKPQRQPNHSLTPFRVTGQLAPSQEPKDSASERGQSNFMYLLYPSSHLQNKTGGFFSHPRNKKYEELHHRFRNRRQKERRWVVKSKAVSYLHFNVYSTLIGTEQKKRVIRYFSVWHRSCALPVARVRSETSFSARHRIWSACKGVNTSREKKRKKTP